MPDSIASADLIDMAVHGTLVDPFAFFGPHRTDDGTVIRSFQPGALAVDIRSRQTQKKLGDLSRIHPDGLFSGQVEALEPYLLHISWPNAEQETEDPYSFGKLLGDVDMYLMSEGSHRNIGDVLGAQIVTVDGIRGVRFAVWAPNARRVSVVGDFNSWDGRRHPMRLRHSAGIWEIFLPRLLPGIRYKYELIGPHGHLLPLKADPVALYAEVPPATASVVADISGFEWHDDEWLGSRAERQGGHAPLSIYELHTGSWLRPEGEVPMWRDLADRLIPYVTGLGFTHIELLPVMEHPFLGSWGYQPLGLFAPTSRHGTPEDFAEFIDRCHEAELGVILDWVPGHFPNDAHGLASFDGTHLYEHQDPREGFHQDWDTLIYNYGRREVRAFLIASALHWLRRYHVDGLRVDAVASMLYRDYSREHGQWIPNIYGGRENLEAIQFLQELSLALHDSFPAALLVAEESTAWPGVTKSVAEGGLGFTHKWNMGWMNDTLRYVSHEAVHRSYHHDDMTFGLIYSFSERFILPLSHDEVVHGKRSILGRIPGDDWQKTATLRAYLSFMWTHPGKKLIFMGTEFGQESEWNHDWQLEWHLLDQPLHRQLQSLVHDLNRLYRRQPALHRQDDNPASFQWLVGDDRKQSIFAYLRHGDRATDASMLVLCNFTPIPRHDYRVGVPTAGTWHEVLNTDSELYAGTNIGNGGACAAEQVPSHGQEWSLRLTVPPLATLILQQAA